MKQYELTDQSLRNPQGPWTNIKKHCFREFILNHNEKAWNHMKTLFWRKSFKSIIYKLYIHQLYMKLYLQLYTKTIKEIYNERDWKDCKIVMSGWCVVDGQLTSPPFSVFSKLFNKRWFYFYYRNTILKSIPKKVARTYGTHTSITFQIVVHNTILYHKKKRIRNKPDKFAWSFVLPLWEDFLKS